ncbi:hypothetical protein U1Q18_032498 [Sarracenia purpurea var. burkii]
MVMKNLRLRLNWVVLVRAMAIGLSRPSPLPSVLAFISTPIPRPRRNHHYDSNTRNTLSSHSSASEMNDSSLPIRLRWPTQG